MLRLYKGALRVFGSKRGVGEVTRRVPGMPNSMEGAQFTAQCVHATFHWHSYAKDLPDHLEYTWDHITTPDILVVGVALWDVLDHNATMYRDGLYNVTSTLQGLMDQVCHL